jgi:hypothetical protein
LKENQNLNDSGINTKMRKEIRKRKDLQREERRKRKKKKLEKASETRIHGGNGA